LDDSTMRSVVPIQTPHGVLLNMGVIEEVPHAAEKPHLPQNAMRAA